MTIILAKIFGLYFLSVGIALLFDPKRFSDIYQQMMKNEAVLFFGWIMALYIGAFVVSVHNVWVFDWPVILTIVGWWSLIKGVGLMAYSGFAQSFSFMFQRSDNFYRGLGVIAFLLGLFLAYQGWQ